MGLFDSIGKAFDECLVDPDKSTDSEQTLPTSYKLPNLPIINAKTEGRMYNSCTLSQFSEKYSYSRYEDAFKIVEQETYTITRSRTIYKVPELTSYLNDAHLRLNKHYCDHLGCPGHIQPWHSC